MVNINKTRTHHLVPNSNKSFPVGTIKMMEHYYQKLGFERIFSSLKSKGHDINSLLLLLLEYKFTENGSINKAADWINQGFLLDRYGLDPVHRQTLYLALELLGEHMDDIIASIQKALFEAYDFHATDINLDWTSIVMHGNMTEFILYGYSRDHRPDKCQITIGFCEIAAPYNIPIAITVRAGNVNDQTHFADTYGKVRHLLKDESLVIFDKGAHSKANVALIAESGNRYLTAKKLNKSDEKNMAAFEKSCPEALDAEGNVRAVTIVKPKSRTFLYFSKTLYAAQMRAAERRAREMVDDAMVFYTDLRAGRKVRKRFLGPAKRNVLIKTHVSVQTLLADMDYEQAYGYALTCCTSGKEGFFALKTNADVTAAEALVLYRKKDSIEKLFHSFKNEIKVKPVRCWKKERIIGVLLIGFIIQLFVSLLRHDAEIARHTCTNFIKKCLRNLTETVIVRETGEKRRVYSNFDPMNVEILRNCGAIS